jgi:hypothetical protein
MTDQHMNLHQEHVKQKLGLLVVKGYVGVVGLGAGEGDGLGLGEGDGLGLGAGGGTGLGCGATAS